MNNQLTVYDLIREDMYLEAVQVSNSSDIEIKIFNEKWAPVFHEITSPTAWESLVNIAEQVLKINQSIK